jgi:hypothetical protein
MLTDQRTLDHILFVWLNRDAYLHAEFADPL